MAARNAVSEGVEGETRRRQRDGHSSWRYANGQVGIWTGSSSIHGQDEH